MNLSARKLQAFAYWKIVLIWTVIIIIGSGGFILYNSGFMPKIPSVNISTQTEETRLTQDNPDAEGIAEEDFVGIIDDSSALNSSAKENSALIKQKEQKSPDDTSTNFNILVLGIDRRYASQTSWRSDVIQLITLSPDRKHAVITHIPRDVWAGNYKINAVYNLQGPDAIKDEINKLTGQRPDRIIRVDFDAFVYAVDAANGVTIDNPVEFTDSGYPDDRSGGDGLMTVTFEKGEQVMDGERALIYVRSRKGNNGEGSDYARGTRQQRVMKAIVGDFFKPGNLFTPKTAETLYKIATEKVYTDLNLKDTQILFEVMKNYKEINIKELGLDTTNYLVVPSDRAAYGGAWTLIPRTDYLPIHEAINTLLKGEDLPNPNISGIESAQ